MAATGNEVTTLKQFKNAVAKKSASPATETSYGTVKLISDEDFESYVNSTSGDSTVTGQEVFTLSQLKSVLSDINSGGSGDERVTLWQGNATITSNNTYNFSLSDSVSHYIRIEIDVLPEHTEYFDPSVMDGSTLTKPSGFFLYMEMNSVFQLFNNVSGTLMVTKITGIK